MTNTHLSLFQQYSQHFSATHSSSAASLNGMLNHFVALMLESQHCVGQLTSMTDKTSKNMALR
jgi:hypothetical protein